MCFWRLKVTRTPPCSVLFCVWPDLSVSLWACRADVDNTLWVKLSFYVFIYLFCCSLVKRGLTWIPFRSPNSGGGGCGGEGICCTDIEKATARSLQMETLRIAHCLRCQDRLCLRLRLPLYLSVGTTSTARPCCCESEWRTTFTVEWTLNIKCTRNHSWLLRADDRVNPL